MPPFVLFIPVTQERHDHQSLQPIRIRLFPVANFGIFSYLPLQYTY